MRQPRLYIDKATARLSMTLNVLCVATCDLHERDHNSSDFKFLCLEPANKGDAGAVSRVEGWFTVRSIYYSLAIKLQTSLGERSYKAEGQDALLWIAGGRIEADTVNGKRFEQITIFVDKTVSCPRDISPRIYRGIRMVIRGRISEI